MSKRYEASPIIEALCQFQFEPDAYLDLTIPGLIYEQVKKDFPKRNQVAQVNIGVAVNAEIIGQQIGALPLMQFMREDSNTLIQVGQNLLTINQLAPYSSWQEFLLLIEEGLQAYLEAPHPKRIQRVVLHYLNRIEFNQKVQIQHYLYISHFL